MDWDRVLDLFSVFLIGIMLIASAVIITYSVTKEIHSCTSQPFLYGIHQATEEGYNYTYVKIYIYEDINSIAPVETLEFNWGTTLINKVSYKEFYNWNITTVNESLRNKK